MQGMLNRINGIEIRVSTAAVTSQQCRFPRTKKKRIQQKWKQDKRNYCHKPGMIMIGNTVAFVHPAIYPHLVDAVKHQEEEHFNKWG